MSAGASSRQSAVDPQTRRLVIKLMLKVAIFTVILAAVLFLAAGRLDWPGAWVYLGLCVVVTAVILTAMIRTNPDLMAERAQIKKDAKRWDVVLVVLVKWGPFWICLVAGLDARFGWSGGLPLGLRVAAFGLGLAGQLLVAWAMASNRFFSAIVRIQRDRGHVVEMSGPYRFVRHPGYVGMSAFQPASPLILGSWWALIPAVLIVCVLVLRTALEDRTLRAELDGYGDYAQQVRYRLLPGIW